MCKSYVDEDVWYVAKYDRHTNLSGDAVSFKKLMALKLFEEFIQEPETFCATLIANPDNPSTKRIIKEWYRHNGVER